MRDYSKVSPRFWTGETGRQIRAFGAPTQTVAFYLFTSPHANMLGLYYIGLPTLCHETGRTLEEARKALQSLSEVGFAHYDEACEHVYLPNMAREQLGERLQRKDNRHVAVLRELESVRKTPFFNDFLNKYRTAFELESVQIKQGASEPLRSQEQEQEQEQYQEQEQESEGASAPLVTAGRTRSRPRRAFDPATIAGLNVEAWSDYVTHRRKIGVKALTDEGAMLLATKLATHDQATQRAMIDQTREKGWTGVFDLKSNGAANGAHGKPWVAPRSVAELQAEQDARDTAAAAGGAAVPAC